jgi:YHS domain-containing protein
MGPKENVSKVRRDPVCKMEVKDECRIVSNYKGEEYQFCSEDCKQAFELDPEKYIK